MRDLLVGLVVFGSLPFILKRPFLGILLMAGLGYMNPHRLCYGFMLTVPVVQIAAIATLIADDPDNHSRGHRQHRCQHQHHCKRGFRQANPFNRDQRLIGIN